MSQWYFTRADRKTIGPVTARELKHLASSGGLLPTDRVRRGSSKKMLTASRVKGLFAPPAGLAETPTA
jgi:hypothetical protein